MKWNSPCSSARRTPVSLHRACAYSLVQVQILDMLEHLHRVRRNALYTWYAFQEERESLFVWHVKRRRACGEMAHKWKQLYTRSEEVYKRWCRAYECAHSAEARSVCPRLDILPLYRMLADLENSRMIPCKNAKASSFDALDQTWLLGDMSRSSRVFGRLE
jgi:hypothetical protein